MLQNQREHQTVSKQRFLNPTDHQVVVREGVAYCRYCKTNPLKGRRKAFCSDNCVHEFKIRMYGSYARAVVEQRDRGLCELCGFDTEKARRILLLLSNRFDEYFTHLWHQQLISYEDCRRLTKLWNDKFSIYNYHPSLQAYKNLLSALGFSKKHLWEADHTKPVVFGGGEAGLDNLRTLCVPCHKRETRKLRRAMSGRKKSATKEAYWGRDR